MEIIITIKCSGGSLANASEFLSAIKDFDCKVVMIIDSVGSVGKLKPN